MTVWSEEVCGLLVYILKYLQIRDKNCFIFVKQFCHLGIISMKTKNKYFTLFHTIISYSGIKYFNKIVSFWHIPIRWVDAGGFSFELAVYSFLPFFLKRINKFILCCKLCMTSQSRTAIYFFFNTNVWSLAFKHIKKFL